MQDYASRLIELINDPDVDFQELCWLFLRALRDEQHRNRELIEELDLELRNYLQSITLASDNLPPEDREVVQRSVCKVLRSVSLARDREFESSTDWRLHTALGAPAIEKKKKLDFMHSRDSREEKPRSNFRSAQQQ